MAVAPDIKIQRYYVDIGESATTADYTLPSAVGSLGSAFVRLIGVVPASLGNVTPYAQSSGSSIAPRYWLCGVYFQSTTTVRAERFAAPGSGGSIRVFFEVWEYVGSVGGANEFITRAQNWFSFTTTSSFASVASVGTRTKLVPINAGCRSNLSTGGMKTLDVRVSIDPARDRINFNRNDSSIAVFVRYAVVEFTGSNWTVYQNINHTFTSAETEEATSKSFTDVDHTFHFSSFQHAGDNSSESGCLAYLKPSDDTKAYFYIGPTTTPGSTVCTMHAVYNPGVTVEHRSSMWTGESNIAGNAYEEAFDILPVDPDYAGTDVRGVVEDNNQNYPSQSWNGNLTDYRTFTMYRHGYSNYETVWGFQIINFGEVNVALGIPPEVEVTPQAIIHSVSPTQTGLEVEPLPASVAIAPASLAAVLTPLEPIESVSPSQVAAALSLLGIVAAVSPSPVTLETAPLDPTAAASPSPAALEVTFGDLIHGASPSPVTLETALLAPVAAVSPVRVALETSLQAPVYAVSPSLVALETALLSLVAAVSPSPVALETSLQEPLHTVSPVPASLEAAILDLIAAVSPPLVALETTPRDPVHSVSPPLVSVEVALQAILEAVSPAPAALEVALGDLIHGASPSPAALEVALLELNDITQQAVVRLVVTLLQQSTGVCPATLAAAVRVLEAKTRYVPMSRVSSQVARQQRGETAPQREQGTSSGQRRSKASRTSPNRSSSNSSVVRRRKRT